MHERVRIDVRACAANLARTCVALAVAAGLPWASAQAFDPEPGSELLATDAGGQRFVGFGTVDADGVRLELQGPAQELRIVLIAPDGSSTTYRAAWRAGRLLVSGADLPEEEGTGEPDEGPANGADLADLLATGGRGLWVAVDGAEASLVAPSDDADRARAEPDVDGEPGGPDPDAPDADVPDPDVAPDDDPRLPLPPRLPEIDRPDAGPLFGDPDADEDPDDASDADADDEAEDEAVDEEDPEEDAEDPLPDLPGLP